MKPKRKYEILSDIDFTKIVPRKQYPSIYPFARVPVGKSFIVEPAERKLFAPAMTRYMDKTGKIFTLIQSPKEGEEGLLRCGRVS